MTALKRQDTPEAKDFFSWDFFYYDKRLRITRRGLDDEKIQEYFPLERVVDKMLDISGTFLGVSFKEIAPAANAAAAPAESSFDNLITYLLL